jgi:hypothetical protein
MELKITGTEQEIYSLLSKFQTSTDVGVQQQYVVEVDKPEVKSITRIDTHACSTENKKVNR